MDSGEANFEEGFQIILRGDGGYHGFFLKALNSTGERYLPTPYIFKRKSCQPRHPRKAVRFLPALQELTAIKPFLWVMYAQAQCTKCKVCLIFLTHICIFYINKHINNMKLKFCLSLSPQPTLVLVIFCQPPLLCLSQFLFVQTVDILVSSQSKKKMNILFQFLKENSSFQNQEGA